MKTKAFFLLFCCLAAISPAGAQTVSTIISSGDPANRIDVVVLAEGYTSAESAKFTSDANTFMNAFFNVEIYVDYKTYFNVRALFVASAESGATHLETTPQIIKNTAFGAFYGCAGIARLICADSTKVNAAVSAALPANQRDYIFVLVNDSTYGGSGGSFLVSSTNSQAVEIILHEFGHTHGLLADEYTSNPPPCNPAEPSAANATAQTVRAQIKWSLWIDAATPVPTTSTAPGVPGLYEGADYCATGMYRPTFNSRMRALGNPYEQVNDEQMVRRFYNFVSTIDSANPLGASLSAVQGAKPSFSVTPLQPVQHSLAASWFVDGVLAASGTNFVLDTSALSVASHTVKVVVKDNTTWVRSDPNNLTMDSQTWTVAVAQSGTPQSSMPMMQTPTSQTLDSSAAAASPITPPCGNGSVQKAEWFSFTPAANGSLTVDSSGSTYRAIIGGYTGSVTNLTNVGCAVAPATAAVRAGVDALAAPASLTLQVTRGTTYYFLVTAFDGVGGTLLFNISFTSSASIPNSALVTALPHVVRGGGYVTKMTVTNMTRTTNNVVLNYVAPDGTLVESQTRMLSPAGTARIATPEAQRSQTAALQWATVGSDAAISANLFFELADAGGNVLNTVGFNNAPPVTSFVIPVEFEIAVGRTVGLALANPSGTPASVTLNLVNAQGTVIATSTFPLAALAKTSFDVSSTAPFQAALAALGNVNFIGTLTGSSTVPVDILGVGDDKGPFFSTPPLPAGATRLVVPHMVIGGGFLTKLTFVNLTASANTATIIYYGQNGAVLTNTGLPGSVPLAANGAARIAPPESARTAGAQISWALVTSTGALGVNLFFEFANGSGAIVNTIGFNQVPELTSFTFPVEMEQSNGVFIRTVGLALANAGTSTATVTLTLVDSIGNALATSQLALPSLNQTSIDLSTVAAFKAVLPAGNFIGSVTVTSNVPIVGLALEADRGPFSAVPPVAGTPN